MPSVSGRRLRACAALLAFSFLISGCGSGNTKPPDTIMTEDGPVRGIRTSTVDEYLGIPYAAPPQGKLRWEPPQRHGPWSGILNAVSFGNECMQPGPSTGETAGSEDCLFLNVYRPHYRTGNLLPVMVWIHGGGLRILSGAFDVPPALLEKGNVIIVSMNYRLGVLGFFAHPAIDSEGHLNADYGLMDQQFALGWVRRNIAAFGGDPDRITIFGTSAGTLSVYSQLASPTAAGLFQRAIAQCGTYEGGFASYQRSIIPIAEAETDGQEFAAKFGCSSAACLRSIPAEHLVLAQRSGDFFPIIDGNILTQTPGAAFASGRFNRVPVISGTNHDDYRFVVAIEYDFGPGPLTDAQYPTAIAGLLQLPLDDPFVSTVLNKYPLSNFGGNASIALGAAGTDRVDACPGLIANRSLAQWVPTYVDEFSDEHAPSFFDRPVSFPLGAYHSAEVLYLLKTNLLNPDQHKLSDIWIGYWTQFAASADPNSADAPHWPLFGADSMQIQSLTPPTPAIETNFANYHKCDFWTP